MRIVTKAAYAAPAVGLAGLGLPLLIYLPEYYGTVVGLPLGLVGMAFLMARLADIIVDPLAGALIDRTRSRHGRFRFWLALGTPLLMLSVYGLFMPPLGPPQAASLTRLVLCLAGTYAAWSLCFVAHVGWGSTLSNDYDERNAIFAWCQALFLVGGLAITAIPLLPALRATPEQALPAMGWFILLSLPVGVALALLLVREHPAGLRRPPDWNDYRRLLGQAGIARLLAADFLSSTAVYAAGGVFFFYYGFIHGLAPAETAALLFAVKLGAIAGAYLWGRLGTLLEKHRALALGFGGLALMTLVVHLLPWSGRTAGMVILGGFGVLLSADPVLVRSMMADLGDERRLATGADQMGTMVALLSVSDKLSAAIGPALALAALGWAGFDPQAAQQTSLALNTLTAAAIWVPLVLQAAAVPLVWRHPLTASRHQAIRTELAVLEGGD
ncbi:MFS transporter [Nitrospirillum iridis]|uniref:Na+/melibiose symporter-like transporter n=1 Tax=Nitrospirillum iridis TaxID=765888 RepID=A0A7X0B059_9PROT|nr:MFS transporter [Nitrospirillum iridis]MBB6252932.1 Na+/melibiose symporter-like transporter [Nitrospirillum iridis]